MSAEVRADVIVIGAGAAGMSAAQRLRRRGVDVHVVEASTCAGGRMRHRTDFVDRPISLGAEWLTAPASELNEIVGVETHEPITPLRAYGHGDTSGYFDGELSIGPLRDFGYLNFVESSWCDLFERFVLPEIEDTITYGVEIVSVDHRGDEIRLRDRAGAVHVADRVIVTVPLRALQSGHLTFDPPLPRAKRRAVGRAPIWNGVKIFLEFDEPFFPTFLEFPDSDTPTGQRSYHDAMIGRATDRHVLAHFAVGDHADRLGRHEPDAAVEIVLAELDQVFGGAASRTHRAHLVQDWAREPFVHQAYLADTAPSRLPPRLWAPIDERVFFAGEAYTRHDDWGGVDDAARAARDAVDRLLR